MLVIAIIQGALGGLAFWVLGLPSALLWTVVMMLLSMIPMAGAFVVWVPAAIYLASDASAGMTGQSIIADEYNRSRGLPAPYVAAGE